MMAWVLTQDRQKIVCCSGFEIGTFGANTTIYGYPNYSGHSKDGIVLGIYQNRARLMEVFNEIQKHIEQCLFTIYEMPQ